MWREASRGDRKVGVIFRRGPESVGDMLQNSPQGLVMNFFYPSTDNSKVVFRVVSRGIKKFVTNPCELTSKKKKKSSLASKHIICSFISCNLLYICIFLLP